MKKTKQITFFLLILAHGSIGVSAENAPQTRKLCLYQGQETHCVWAGREERVALSKHAKSDLLREAIKALQAKNQVGSTKPEAPKQTLGRHGTENKHQRPVPALPREEQPIPEQEGRFSKVLAFMRQTLRNRSHSSERKASLQEMEMLFEEPLAQQDPLKP